MKKRPFLTNLIAMIAFLAMSYIGGMAETALAYVWPEQAIFISYFVIYPICFGLPMFIIIKKAKGSFKEVLGLGRINLLTIPIAVVIAVLVQPIASFIALFFSQFSNDFVTSAMTSMNEAMPLWQMILVMAIFPAVFEELMFRGVVMRGFHSKYPRWIGIVFSALLFALMHGNFQQLSYAFFLGIIFALIASATDSSWATMLIHFLFNGTSVLAVYFSTHPEKLTNEFLKEYFLGSAEESAPIPELLEQMLPGVLECLLFVAGLILLLYVVNKRLRARNAQEAAEREAAEAAAAAALEAPVMEATETEAPAFEAAPVETVSAEFAPAEPVAPVEPAEPEKVRKFPPFKEMWPYYVFCAVALVSCIMMELLPKLLEFLGETSGIDFSGMFG